MIIVEHRQEAASLKDELAMLKKRYLERKRREQQQAAGAPAQTLAACASPAEGEDPTLPARHPAAGTEASPDGASRLHVQGETSPRGRAAERAASGPQVVAAHAPSSSMEASAPGLRKSESSAPEAGPALAATAEQAHGAPAGAAPGVGLGLEDGAASGSPVALEGTPGMHPEQPDVRWWATDAVAYAAAAGGALDATTGTAAEPADTDRRPWVPGEAELAGLQAE